MFNASDLSDEQRLIGEMERARQASDVLDHPRFKEAFEVYRQRLNDEWAASPSRDMEGREKIWLMQKSLNAVEDHLKELIQTGKLASIQWEQKQTLSQRAMGQFRKLL